MRHIYVVLHTVFLVAEDVITATDIKFEYAMPDTVEELTHRNPKAMKERIIKAFLRAGTWRGAAKLFGISERHLIQLRKRHGINRNGETET